MIRNIVFVLVLLCSQPLLAGQIMELYPIVSVSEQSVCVEDVFVTYGNAKDSVDHYRCIQQAELQTALTDDRIAREALSKLFKLGDGVQLIGAESAKFHFKSDEAAHTNIVVKLLEEHWSHHFYDFNVKHVEAINICRSDKEDVWRLRRPVPSLSSQFCIWLDGYEKSQRVCSEYHCASIEAKGKFPVAAFDMAPNTIITKSDVSYDELTLGESNELPLNLEDGVQYITKAAIAKDHTFSEKTLKPRTDVVNGFPVEVEAHQGAIRIRFTAMAMQDGQIGQQVRVKHYSGNGYFKALVIDRDRVVING